MTAADYAKLNGLTQSNARHRLEMLTALGFAERRSYTNRATEFTLTATQQAKPVRLAIEDEELSSLIKNRRLSSDSIRVKMIELLKAQPMTSGELRKRLGLHSIEYTQCQLKILRKRYLVDHDQKRIFQVWRALEQSV